ncbi:MAG: glycosyltransferase, partial [Planctomycetota bacterium]
EEAFLADCLASVAGVVHESIVVDTGSRDRTREIAAAAGARVIDFPWRDDFAAARNEGLVRATGTHVLVLDADERLAPNMGDSLLAAAANDDLLLGCLPLYNASSMDATPDEVLSGAKRLGEPAFVPRLFRNLPEMRFDRRVHETLTRGFNVLQARGVGRSIAVGAALLHLGDVPSYRASRAKDERNERLLRMCLEDDPADGEIAGYLVVHLIKTGRAAEARAVGERHFAPFLARNEARPPGYLPDNMVRIGYALALAQSDAGDHGRALETVLAAARHTPDGHPNLDYVEGLAHLGLGEHDAAEACFERAIAAHGKRYAQPVLGGVTDELPRLKLAWIRAARGDTEAARRGLPPAQGRWRFARELVAAEIELEAGRPEAAMERLAPFVDVNGLAPDWHALTHRALAQLGKDADELLAVARQSPASAWLEPRRMTLTR